jgi:hypothetical protein
MLASSPFAVHGQGRFVPMPGHSYCVGVPSPRSMTEWMTEGVHLESARKELARAPHDDAVRECRRTRKRCAKYSAPWRVAG